MSFLLLFFYLLKKNIYMYVYTENLPCASEYDKFWEYEVE